MGRRGALETLTVAALGIGCCVGLPVLAAAGLSVGLLALTGGLAAALVGLGVATLVLIVRWRRRAEDHASALPTRREKGALMPRSRNAGARGPLVEVLYFDGCPNHLEAVALVERLSGELGLDSEVRLVNIPDPATAERERFLGSPTIRVDGRDVEPGAGERTDFALSCRVYRTAGSLAGQPPETWVREALAEAARPSVTRA